MKILITGASSYVGARLYFDLSRLHDVTGTYSQNKLSKKFVHMDITNHSEVVTVLEKIKPDCILHVAQNPDPRWCEAHPAEALSLNLESTRQLTDSANMYKTTFIYISSFAAIKPINVYARTKYESELLTKNVKAGYIIVRPSFILGYSPNTKNDRPFNRLLRNLDQGTPAEYDTSWKFQPTYLGHMSKVILDSINRNIWNKTIHVTVPDLKTRYDTAYDILTPFGVTVTKIDKKDTTPVIKNDLSELKELRLPQYSYSQIIQEIIEEIREKSRFVV